MEANVYLTLICLFPPFMLHLSPFNVACLNSTVTILSLQVHSFIQFYNLVSK